MHGQRSIPSTHIGHCSGTADNLAEPLEAALAARLCALHIGHRHDVYSLALGSVAGREVLAAAGKGGMVSFFSRSLGCGAAHKDDGTPAVASGAGVAWGETTSALLCCKVHARWAAEVCEALVVSAADDRVLLFVRLHCVHTKSSLCLPH